MKPSDAYRAGGNVKYIKTSTIEILIICYPIKFQPADILPNSNYCIFVLPSIDRFG